MFHLTDFGTKSLVCTDAGAVPRADLGTGAVSHIDLDTGAVSREDLGTGTVSHIDLDTGAVSREDPGAVSLIAVQAILSSSSSEVETSSSSIVTLPRNFFFKGLGRSRDCD